MSGSESHVRARSFAAAVARIPISLVVVVGIGIALRIALSSAYSPAYAHSYDSILYVDVAAGELFGDATRTVGYPLFLRGVHALSTDLDLTIQLQHLLGLATAFLLFGAVRRLGAPIWAALVAAGAVLLSLDQIFLEHILMAEAPYTALLAAGLYAAVRALGDSVPSREAHLWLAAAGAALGLAAWLRPVTLPIALFVAIWAYFALAGDRRSRLANAAIALGGAAAFVVPYFAISAVEGNGFGFGTASGWALYSRVAPFADCGRFDPPVGTERLCEESDPDARNGPDFYGWQPDSPARRLYGEPPNGDGELGDFATAAIVAQPFDYLGVVARDLVRYFHPAFAPQDFSGLGYEEMDVETRLPDTEDDVLRSLNAYYGDETVEVRDDIATLGDVQEVVRVHPKLMLVAVVLALAAMPFADRRLRAAIVLMLGFAAISMLVPPATSIWSARYAIPVGGVVAAAGAIGAWVLARRLGPASSEAGRAGR